MSTRSRTTRLELSSYRLLNKGDSDSDRDSDSDSSSAPDLDNRGDTGNLNDRFPAAEFKDKMYAAGQFRIYEIYNPEKEDHMYFEVPPAQNEEKNEEDSDDASGKRKREEEEESDYGYYGHTYFALTGPDEGMVVCDTFDVVAHKVDPATDDDYLDRATRAYLAWRRIPGDNAITVTHGRASFYNYPNPIKIDLGFGSSLKLNYLVITDSKLVTVAIHWLFVQGKGDDGQENHIDTDDINICGNVSVFSEKHLDHRSVLLQTPKDKAVKVIIMQDNLIPLSRSLVAVPYKSAFTVEADLYNPIDGSFVQGSATFPFREINTEMPSYVDSDYISIGSATHKIKVVVTVGL